MTREFWIALLVSLTAHAALVGVGDPLHDRNEGKKVKDQNIVLLGVVDLSAPAAPEAPSEPPPAQPTEVPAPVEPGPPLPVVEPLPQDVHDPFAAFTPELEGTPVPEEATPEAPAPVPHDPIDKEVAKLPEQSSQLPAEVPMVERHANVAQQRLTAGQIEDLRSRYLRAVLEQLEKAKRYPRFAYVRGMEGTVEMSFAVFRDGHVSDPGIRQSSGYASLDAAALEMVSRATPFLPIPAELKTNRLNLVVPVAFKIERTPR